MGNLTAGSTTVGSATDGGAGVALGGSLGPVTVDASNNGVVILQNVSCKTARLTPL